MDRLPGSLATSAAERMRRYRARRRASGLRLDRRWVQADSAAPSDRDTSYSDHRLLELRSLAMHGAIARKLRTHPGILEHARSNIDRWLARRDADDPGRTDLEAWRAWLDRPIGSLTAFMTAWTEEAIRMRQSTPFAGVLRPAERRAIYDAFRA